MRKLLTLLLVAALALSLLAGCAKSDADVSASPDVSGEPSSAFPLTLTDMTGRTVTIGKLPEKVVALTAANAEIVYALGSGSLVVGRGEYCDYPTEISDVPAFTSGAETNIEQIIAAAPDVVFIDTMAQTEAQIQQLADAGIPVVVSDGNTIGDTYVNIELIGKALGKTDEAAAIIDGMKSVFDGFAAAKVEGTVYFEVSSWDGSYFSAGKGTFLQEIADLTGLVNIFGEESGWPTVSEEQIIDRNPDYIVSLDMWGGDPQLILARPAWADVTAVKSGTVVYIPDSLARPGPRLSDGAAEMYEFVKAHPVR